MIEHRIPAIDRAVEILTALSAQSPASIRDICQRSKLARSTVYRTLNTLEAHGLVQKDSQGGYVLGVALLKLARAVPQGTDIVALARPVMEELAARLGASTKLSIVDGDDALVVAVTEAPGTYSITTQVGRRFPLHAGAASKLLLANLPAARQTAILGARLQRLTSNTITDPALLSRILAEIRERGFAEDSGEYVDGVRAFAAPIRDAYGECIAAISVPFVITADAERARVVLQNVVEAARKISASAGAENQQRLQHIR